LYTGTSASKTINNGLTESTSGALTWIKPRSGGDHQLFDTVRGANNALSTDVTAGQYSYTDTLNSFNSNGFTLGADSNALVNQNNVTYASWTFRKQPKFFDIVTYTGNGSYQTINHNLGSVPGCIIVKRTDSNGTAWVVYHQSLNSGVTPEQYYLTLNTTSSIGGPNSTIWNNTAPTSTNFSVGSATSMNASGGTYVAYIFGAGGTGGFGLTGTQDIISCGSLSTNSSGAFSVNLGWEPQFLIVKRTDGTGGWFIADTMRGWNYTNGFTLYANDSSAEQDGFIGIMTPNATGFACTGGFGASRTYIYIAIRRGPMATPTTGTSVFAPVVQSVTSTPAQVTTGFVTDFVPANYIAGGNKVYVIDRLRGDSQTNGNYLIIDTFAEATGATYGYGLDNETGYIDNFWYTAYGAGSYIYWNFARAPGFFDEVCYTGTASVQNINHNLNVAPQLMFVKERSATNSWYVYNVTTGNSGVLFLNGTNAFIASATPWNATTPTSSVFTVGSTSTTNASGQTYVAYLFATVTGVSYVGSYTGNGTGQSISCGFGASGARFILIKRTDSTGNWYCFDSANGLTSSSSPYLLWNSAAAQVTGNNGVYASSGGFTLGSTASTTTNISSASYIFLSIA